MTVPHVSLSRHPQPCAAPQSSSSPSGWCQAQRRGSRVVNSCVIARTPTTSPGPELRRAGCNEQFVESWGHVASWAAGPRLLRVRGCSVCGPGAQLLWKCPFPRPDWPVVRSCSRPDVSHSKPTRCPPQPWGSSLLQDGRRYSIIPDAPLGLDDFSLFLFSPSLFSDFLQANPFSCSPELDAAFLLLALVEKTKPSLFCFLDICFCFLFHCSALEPCAVVQLERF